MGVGAHVMLSTAPPAVLHYRYLFVYTAAGGESSPSRQGPKRSRSLEPMDILRARNVTRDTIVADRVEVAATSETRRRGLLGRTGLEAGTGLWLVPCEWVHMFGMKFAIDILVLDRNNVVVGLQEGLKPGWIGKLFWGAHSTLELPLGAIRSSRTAKGDRIEWEEHTAG